MANKVSIEKAKRIDIKEITELTIRSKSYWDYDKSQIDEWKDDLTVTEEYIEINEVYKLIVNGIMIGYYSYFKLSDTELN